MKVKKVVIPAAGLGTRFLPATKAEPKEMLPIVDKPTIQYIVEEAIASGIEDIIIITGRTKRSIEDHFDKSYELESELEKHNKTELLKLTQDISNMANIFYVRQKEALGLGHAILCAKALVNNEPFAVMLGDDVVDAQKPCLKQLIDVYEEYGSTVLGVQKVPESDTHMYGIVDGVQISDRVYDVKNLVEKPAIGTSPSNIAILGRYVINPDIFGYLETQTPGAGGEIQLTDALKRQMQSEKMIAYNFEGRRYDVGNKLGFLQATVEFALKREDLKDDFKAYLKTLNI